MKKYLIEMINGGIIDIAEDGWTESEGCETCGYGGWHIAELDLKMESCILRIKAGSQYDFDMPSYIDLVDWFDKNIEKINSSDRISEAPLLVRFF